MTAVIVNYNAWADVVPLVDVLASTHEVAHGLCEVVVVDNASAGPIPSEFREDRPGITLVTRDDNGGFAVGVNAGWRIARSPWLLLINPDVLASPELLGRVVERVQTFEQAPDQAPGIVGFGLRNPDGSPQPSVGVFPTLGRIFWEVLLPRSRRKYRRAGSAHPGPVEWVTGACMLVNGRMLEATGGLDEEFFLYYEEVALCRSAQRLGWRVEYDPSIEVVHLRPLQNRKISPTLRVITRHSKLLYFRKHLPRWQFLSLCGLVALEARVRGVWAGLARDSTNVHAWRTIGAIERALRRGETLGGTRVRDLAESSRGSLHRSRQRTLIRHNH